MTLIIPFRRYHFGISSTSEIYQRCMLQVLEDEFGVISMQEDVLIYSKDQHEHDAWLTNTLKKIQAASITLNSEKCKKPKLSLKFLRHMLSADDLWPDLERVIVVFDFPTPTDITETRWFIGMVNQMKKWLSSLLDMNKPLRDLLSQRYAFISDSTQQKAFSSIKGALCSAPEDHPSS